jgi:alanine dehydrogenase
MQVLSEAAIRPAVDILAVIQVIEEVFASLAAGRAQVFPVVSGHGLSEADRFSVKSGLLADRGLVGMKVGTYWPGNRAQGLPNHGSTTFLLDAHTGAPRAAVSATYLTALRTAAADAIAVKHLARAEASSVAVIGAGHQAWYDLLAVAKVRALREVRVWSRNPERAADFARRAQAELGLAATATGIEAAVRSADVVLTVTASRAALVQRDWISAGAHVSAMGADAPGKQELDVNLVAAARLFADVPAQSVVIGEFQAACRAGLVRQEDIGMLGAVISGTARGRVDAREITIFDSSGIALQDLAVADLALRSVGADRITNVDFA